MPTKHRRIHVSFKPKVIKNLEFISKEQDKSLSQVTQELVEEALELHEDFYLSKLAEDSEIRSKGKPTRSHQEVCRKFGLKSNITK
jgi:hypothetical protein